MTLEEWKSLGKPFTHKGHSVFYTDQGSGEALMLLHGYPTASWDFEKIMPVLLTKFRVLAPDFIGFGFSDKPKDYRYSIPDQADLVTSLLKQLEIKEVHIVAHDYAVSVAQELLARHEQASERSVKILSIVFLNGGLFPETHKARLIQKLLHGPLGFLIVKFMNYERFRKSFSTVFGHRTQPSEAELKDFWKLITYNEGQTISHKLIQYITDRRVHRDRWVKAMQQTSVPLRLINGNADPISGLHMTQRYAELIPHADVIHLKEIGHYPQVEAPEVVLEGILDFIGAIPHG